MATLAAGGRINEALVEEETDRLRKYLERFGITWAGVHQDA